LYFSYLSTVVKRGLTINTDSKHYCKQTVTKFTEAKVEFTLTYEVNYLC